jgi:hypothetical protein
MVASFQSTIDPFIQILPVPAKAMAALFPKKGDLFIGWSRLRPK